MSLTLSLISRKKQIQPDNSRKYGVRHKDKWHPLDKSEQFKIKIAVIAGTFFFAGGLVERMAKNYYCNQLKTELRAKDTAKQLSRTKNKAIKLCEDTEELVHRQARHYQLVRVPAHKKHIANPTYFSPFSTRSPAIRYVYYTKKMNEPLSPTVKAALWRRAYLYR